MYSEKNVYVCMYTGWCEEASQWAEVSVGRGGNTSSLCMPALFCFKVSSARRYRTHVHTHTYMYMRAHEHAHTQKRAR